MGERALHRGDVAGSSPVFSTIGKRPLLSVRAREVLLNKGKAIMKYYEAYDERYKTIHDRGYSWASDENTPIVIETIGRYQIAQDVPMLEIGCGEGRDAQFLLKKGYDLLATDVSPEAISYCRNAFPDYEDRFQVMDCLNSVDRSRYGFIYAVAVIHMLLLDEDRQTFYRFIREHLCENGIALICSMGDGQTERMTDMGDAFKLQEREHPSGKVMVAATSCRMVSFPSFESELSEAGLQIIEEGMTSCLPEFDALMYAVVRKTDRFVLQ